MSLNVRRVWSILTTDQLRLVPTPTKLPNDASRALLMLLPPLKNSAVRGSGISITHGDVTRGTPLMCPNPLSLFQPPHH